MGAALPCAFLRARSALLAALLLAGLAVAGEAVQIYIPSRTYSEADIAANLLGLTGGLLLGFALRFAFKALVRARDARRERENASIPQPPRTG